MNYSLILQSNPLSVKVIVNIENKVLAIHLNSAIILSSLLTNETVSSPSSNFCTS